jgi:lipoprotein-releasing system ATP-binding protein
MLVRFKNIFCCKAVIKQGPEKEILIFGLLMLTARNLCKKYGSFTVVHDVSLQVAKGEIVSIVGPSGAGKSTLLHLVGGLDKPDSGSVWIDGQDILKLPGKKQARFRNRHIGFVFQFHHLLPEFTAQENVSVPLWIKGSARKEAMQQAADMLGVVGLGGRLGNKPSELSGGEQQRVAIARALVMRPSVIMADEPTGNLDSANAHALHTLFLDLRQKFNQTFVMITHNDLLAKMTDRILTMQDGVIVDEKTNV